MISDQLIFKESGQYDKEVIQHLSIVKFGNSLFLLFCAVILQIYRCLLHQ